MNQPKFNYTQTADGNILLYTKIKEHELKSGNKFKKAIKKTVFSFATWHGDHELIQIDRVSYHEDDFIHGNVTLRLVLKPSHNVMPGILPATTA